MKRHFLAAQWGLGPVATGDLPLMVPSVLSFNHANEDVSQILVGVSTAGVAHAKVVCFSY